MKHLNPLQLEFQKEILRISESAEGIVKKISARQKWITLFAVIIYAVISLIMSFYIENFRLIILISAVMLLFTIPSVVIFSRKEIRRLIPKKIKIDPRIDYTGYWKYNTVFEVFPNHNSPAMDDYHKDILKKSFDNKTESGVCEWTLTEMYELKVVFAEGRIDRNVSITWKTDPIVFDEQKVRWLFKTTIKWKDNRVCLPNIVYGREEYRVKMRDIDGRPTVLSGNLLGCIQQENQYILRAKCTFTKIKKDEYDKLINKYNYRK